MRKLAGDRLQLGKEPSFEFVVDGFMLAGDVQAALQRMHDEVLSSLTAPPADQDAPIWRYLKFERFRYLIENSKLHFARIDQFSDPFEGSVSERTASIRPFLYRGPVAGISTKMPVVLQWARRWMYINCWHANPAESRGMWDLYVEDEPGVVVQSTYKRLRAALPLPVQIGTVQYVDYGRDFMPEGNLLFPALHKRRAFDHEREIRAIFVKEAPESRVPIEELPRPIFALGRPSGGGSYIPDIDARNDEVGIGKEVPLATLIQTVRLAPSSSPSFMDEVRELLTRHGISSPVNYSELDAPPVY